MGDMKGKFYPRMSGFIHPPSKQTTNKQTNKQTNKRSSERPKIARNPRKTSGMFG
jgi:hypothetical protein